MKPPQITVIDIGAWGGASREWSSIGKSVNIIGFEPDEKECRNLNNQSSSHVADQHFYPYAIAGKSGKRDFYVTRRSTVSSLISPIQSEWKKYGVPGSERNRRAEIRKSMKVDAITLEDFCVKNKVSPDFIKIDTQGSELEIIEDGYKNSIDNLIGIEIEVEFTPLYKDQPLFSEIELYLRSHGFQLYGMKRNMWKMHNGKSVTEKSGGRLTFADALFFHKKVLRKSSNSYAIKSALLAYRYGLNDLVEAILSKSKISSREFDSILESVKSSQSGTSFFERLKLKKKDKVVYFDEKYGF